MSIESRIITAVSAYVPDVVPNVYTGKAKEYVVFTYDMDPDVFAESAPDVIRYSIHLDLCTPNGKNPRTLKKNIANALLDAGFTYPTITNVGDEDGQRYTFECEGVDGDA